MTYNYICFFKLIHHQVSIVNSTIVLMTLNNGLFTELGTILEKCIIDTITITHFFFIIDTTTITLKKIIVDTITNT